MNQTRYMILVVDDDDDLVAAIKECLEFEGYEVATALNGEEGLKKLEQITPHLIILDMNMPGMGGFPFLRAVSAAKDLAQIPVFVFTARANLEEFFEGVDVAGFMAKPCEPEDLLREVRRILAAKYSAEPVPPLSAGGKHILLAEADGGHRELLKHMFEAAGHRVTAVPSGTEVLERVVTEKPDVIVMRLVLQGMNGDAVTSVLDEMPDAGKTPVVLYEDSGAIPRERDSRGRRPAAGQRKFIKTARPADILESIRLMFEVTKQE